MFGCFLRPARHQLDHSLTLRIRCSSEIVVRQGNVPRHSSSVFSPYNFRKKKQCFLKTPALFLQARKRPVIKG